MNWFPRQLARAVGGLCRRRAALWATCAWGLATGQALALNIEIAEVGEGNQYMSGEPIILPAASLSTNRFGPGVQVISNRNHVVLPARFDESGRLRIDPGEPTVPPPTSPAHGKSGNGGRNGGTPAEPSPPPPPNGFPAYLLGHPYVWFLQNVRHYTNYACTVNVDQPVTFYLLVDNRINDYLPESQYDDPVFGPPDTQWIRDDGWERVNTGLTPRINPQNAGDYLGIDEGNNGTINQIYSVWRRVLPQPGAVTLRTELDGNIYCLIIATNAPNADPTGREQMVQRPPSGSSR